VPTLGPLKLVEQKQAAAAKTDGLFNKTLFFFLRVIVGK
jgi:hypothetical protein